jgi:hypothetical protein
VRAGIERAADPVGALLEQMIEAEPDAAMRAEGDRGNLVVALGALKAVHATAPLEADR